MKAKNIFGSLLAGFFLLGLVACERNNDDTDDQLKLDAVDQTFAELTFDDVKDVADQAFELRSGGTIIGLDGTLFPMLGACATITHDTISVPRRTVIDFGTVNCLCRDGKYRRGKIIITYTGRYAQPGTVITHTFENYYVNDNKVEGSKVVTNKGVNNNGHMWWTVVEEGTVTKPDNSGSFTWVANHQRIWIEGMLTPRRTDDVFLLKGSSTLTRPNGSTLSKLITKDLRKELSCKWFVSGTVEIKPTNRPKRILDYGEGTCDNTATLTIGNRTITVQLP